MNTFKKTIFLSNKLDNNIKTLGVLSLENKNTKIFCTLKTYNKNINNPDLILGIKFGEKILKQNIILSDDSYNFLINDNVDINANIGCVLFNPKNNFTPIIWGSEKSDNYKNLIVNNLKNNIKKITPTKLATTKVTPNNSTTNREIGINDDNLTPNKPTCSSHNLSKSTPCNYEQNSYTPTFSTTNIDRTQPRMHFHNTYASDSAIPIDMVNGEIDSNIDDTVPTSIDNTIDEVAIAPFLSNYTSTTNNNISNDSNLSNYKDNINLTNYRDNIKTYNYSQISLEEELLKDSDVAIAGTNADLFESTQEEIDNLIDSEYNKDILNKNGKHHNFYNMIAEQLEELFDKYPTEKNLEKLIDNSRWVKINYNNDDRYYVVGIIYQDDDIRYICYGVPGDYDREPPVNLRGYSQWLPTNTMNPYSEGYWVMYQDSDTGENIFIN